MLTSRTAEIAAALPEFVFVAVALVWPALAVRGWIRRRGTVRGKWLDHVGLRPAASLAAMVVVAGVSALFWVYLVARWHGGGPLWALVVPVAACVAVVGATVGWLRKRGTEEPERPSPPVADDDPVDAEIRSGVREWVEETWHVGVIVSVALGAAQAAGRHVEVRASLGVLATATTVVLVLGADVFTDSVRRGLADRQRLRLASLSMGVVLAGVLAVAGSAAILPWLSGGGAWRVVSAAVVGLLGYLSGSVLAAPWSIALRRGLPDTTPGRSTASVPARAPADGTRPVRAPEFVATAEDPFADDTLGRSEEVEQFCRRLLDAQTPAVWSVEGGWGTGKTAFGLMCRAWLGREAPGAPAVSVPLLGGGVTGSPPVDLAMAIAQHLEKHPLYSGDPVERRERRSRLAVLAAQALEPQEYLSAFSRGDKPSHDCISEIRRLLGEYTAGFSGPVVVWIDELDRCPPEYALGVLAAARSVCALDRTVCVLAVNPEPLKHAVHRRLAGDAQPEDLDVYLRRFIDARLDLVTPGEDSFERGENRASFLAGVLEHSGCSGTFEQAGYANVALWELAKSSRLSLRDIEQIVYRVAAVWSGYPDRPDDGYEKAKKSATYSAVRGPAAREAAAWDQTINRALALAILRTLAPHKFAEYRRGLIYPDDSEHPVPLAQDLFRLCRPDTGKDDPPLPELKDLMARLAVRDALRFDDLRGLVRAVEAI